MVLVLAALAAMILSLLFYVFVRCCTGTVIWVTIIVGIAGMLTVGVFFILQAKGVVVS